MYLKKLFYLASLFLFTFFVSTHAMEEEGTSSGNQPIPLLEIPRTYISITHLTFNDVPQTLTIVLFREQTKISRESLLLNIQGALKKLGIAATILSFQYTHPSNPYDDIKASCTLNTTLPIKSSDTSPKLSCSSPGQIQINLRQTTGNLTETSNYVFIIQIPIDLNQFEITPTGNNVKNITFTFINPTDTKDVSWVRKGLLFLRGYQSITSDPDSQLASLWIPPIDWKKYFAPPSSQWRRYALYGAGLVGAAGTAYALYRGPKQAAQDAKNLIEQGYKFLKRKQ